MIYVEYEDGHNEALIQEYNSIEDLAKHITNREYDSYDIVFESLSEYGYYSGCDMWTILSEQDAINKAQHYSNVAEMIRKNKSI